MSQTLLPLALALLIILILVFRMRWRQGAKAHGTSRGGRPCGPSPKSSITCAPATRSSFGGSTASAAACATWSTSSRCSSGDRSRSGRCANRSTRRSRTASSSCTCSPRWPSSNASAGASRRTPRELDPFARADVVGTTGQPTNRTREAPPRGEGAASGILVVRLLRVQIHRSARRHGIADEDIDHAHRQAVMRVELGDDPPRYLVVGPDRSGNLLELVVIGADLSDFVIHALGAPAKHPTRAVWR